MDTHSITGTRGQVVTLYPQDEEFKNLIHWMEEVIGEPISKKMGHLGEITAIVHVKGNPDDEDLHAYIMQLNDWVPQITPVICRLSAPSVLVLGSEEFIC